MKIVILCLFMFLFISSKKSSPGYELLKIDGHVFRVKILMHDPACPCKYERN